MRVALSKWGNSLAVRVPREAAAAAGLQEGAPVELSVEDGAIVLRRRRWDIREMVEAIKGQEPPPLLLDDDEPRGSEFW